jgi:hypothetical protein
MKKTLLALAALSIVFASCVKNELPPPPADDSPYKGKLFINEVNGWPSDDPSKNFELYNATNEAISLDGFYLHYTEQREMWRGRAADVIPAKGWKLIQGANAGYPGFNTGLSNRNANVELIFFDPDGNVIDHYMKIPSLSGTPLEFMCHMRIPDAGKWYYIPSGLATPGAANHLTPPNGSTEMPSMEKKPAVEVVSIAPSPTPDNDVTITVKVVNISSVSSVTLNWKKDGVAQPNINITNSLTDNTYKGIIPKQVEGTVALWTIEASNANGVKASVSGTLTFVVNNADYTKLKLNEVSGVGGDDDKFYELINTGTEPINLAGCKIYYNANGAGGGTLPSGKGNLTWTGGADMEQIIQPGQLLSLIGRSKPGSFSTGLTAARILIITFDDPDGVMIDQCIRAEDTAPYDYIDKSFSRIPDGTGPFYFTTPTPNVMNGTVTTGLVLVPTTQGPPAPDYTKLKINEVNGVAGEDWFEIYNTGTAAINLEGVQAHYSTNTEPANYRLIWTGLEAQTIPAGGFFSTKGTFLATTLSANNPNVRLQLRAPNGTTVLDTYEKLKSLYTGYPDIRSKAHARVPDGTGAWYYTTSANGTPGATNGTSTTGYTKFGEEDGVGGPVDYTKLILTEVSGNNKYVEIYNSGTVSIPLTGVKLQRNDGPGAGGSEWVGTATDAIPAGAYRIFLFNSYTPASLSSLPEYVGWTVSSGISSGQILKVAIVDPSNNPVSVFIRGELPLPAWGYSTGIAQDLTNTYSRMSDGTWAYAAPTPGAANGAKVAPIMSPGYMSDDAANYTNLLLTEVSGNNKYVEIWNSGTASISLNGVKLQRNDGPTGGSEWVGGASDVIPAGAYRIFLFNSYTPASLSSRPEYVGWTVGSGISSGQILKVAIVSPKGNAISTFIRGDIPLPAWGVSASIAQDLTNSYSRISGWTWGYAAPTAGTANGAQVAAITSPGYLTAQP